MNTFKHLALTAVVSLFVLSFNLTAQMQHGESMKPKVEQKAAGADSSMCSQSMDDVSQNMGKATFEETVNGLHVKVWLITQEEHKKMMGSMMKDSTMSGMKRDMGGMKQGDMKMDEGMKGMEMRHGNMDDKDMMEKMMAGTHHIMVVATDAKTGALLKGAHLEVSTLSPTKKTESVRLGTMKDHFGGGITLDEKGEYSIGIKVHVGKGYDTVRFLYTVE